MVTFFPYLRAICRPVAAFPCGEYITPRFPHTVVIARSGSIDTMLVQLNIVSRVWREFRLNDPSAACPNRQCAPSGPHGKMPLYESPCREIFAFNGQLNTLCSIHYHATRRNPSHPVTPTKCAIKFLTRSSMHVSHKIRNLALRSNRSGATAP